jgi:hypothetical protein
MSYEIDKLIDLMKNKHFNFEDLIDEKTYQTVYAYPRGDGQTGENVQNDVFMGIRKLMQDVKERLIELNRHLFTSNRIEIYKQLCKGIYAYAKTIGVYVYNQTKDYNVSLKASNENKLYNEDETLNPDNNFFEVYLNIEDQAKAYVNSINQRNGGKSKKQKNKKNIKKRKTKRSKSYTFRYKSNL